MKVRLLNDSIRIRISQGELNELATGKSVVAKTHFPSANLSYKLSAIVGEKMQIDLSNKCILLEIPSSMIQTLVDTDRVGYEHSIQIDQDTQLDVLFEKDFKCLTPRSEDESDLFNNPLEQANC